MDHTENLAFARAVISEKFCTQEQVDRCLQIQSRTTEGLSLGQSLMREGFITQAQYSRCLELMRKGWKK